MLWLAGPAFAVNPFPSVVYTTCPALPRVDVTTLGVDPVNDPDVAVELDAAIRTATSFGLVAYLPPGSYRFSDPIRPPTGAVVCGAGVGFTVLLPSTDLGAWSTSPGVYGQAAFELGGVDWVQLHDLTFDDEGSKRAFDQVLSYDVLISNSSGDVISNVEFLHHGVGPGAGEQSDPAIYLLALDAPAPHAPYAQVGSVADVTIEDCQFELGTATSNFAIRINTEWPDDEHPKVNPVNTVSNVTVRRSWFTGDYLWNTVEAAGPASFGHLIEDNTFAGYTLAHVDLDKGAHDSRVIGNRITAAGRPVARYTLLPGHTRLELANAIADHGAGLTRNHDNVISGNTIGGITDAQPSTDAGVLSVDQGGIYLQYTDRSTVTGNVITDVYGGQHGSAIVLEGDIVDAVVEGNTVGDPLVVPRLVAYGVVSQLTSAPIDGLDLAGNDLYVGGTGVSLHADGSNVWSVYGNYVDTTSTALPAYVLEGATGADVSWNTAVGGSGAFDVTLPGLTGSYDLSWSSVIDHAWSFDADATMSHLTASGPGYSWDPIHPMCSTGSAVVTVTDSNFTCP